MRLIALLPFQKNAFAGGADPEPKFQGAPAIFVEQNAVVAAAVTFVMITPVRRAAASSMSDRFLELHRGHRIEMGLEGRAR
jgi:hypothetical protein